MSVTKDPTAFTMKFVAEFDATLERVWQLWEDPRQLERWWGPPTYPATVTRYDFTPGGDVSYYMSGPSGDLSRGWWRFVTIEPLHGIEFENGIADETGAPHPSMPAMIVRVVLSEQMSRRTRMSVESVFPSAEVMERFLTMGMEEGMSLAIGQIDELL
jgi:uncharacterized protein YndB with AHSA1/START domain